MATIPLQLIKYFCNMNEDKADWLSKFEKDDYYLTPEGFIVFTEKYHLKRGYCCQSNCRHCPYRKKKYPPTGPYGPATE